MHELSIAMSIIETVEEEPFSPPGRITAIHLRLGALSGVVRDALISAFEIARIESTHLRDAALVIEEVPAIAWCPSCRARQTVASLQWFICPVCGTPVAEVVQGKEIEVVAFEVDDGS